MTPRMDPEEIEYFKTFMEGIPSGTKMVEWGSGGSTAMFLPYFKGGELVSIEHNHEWYEKVLAEVTSGKYSTECLSKFTYVYVAPDMDIRFYGYGVPHEENPCFAAKYINPETRGVTIFDADVYFVDGICRGPILATIANKRRKSAWDDTRQEWFTPETTVFIHDYYGREYREPWYKWASDLYSRIEPVCGTIARLWL
jgi:hypothetical protein